jgi:hypothetical protein
VSKKRKIIQNLSKEQRQRIAEKLAEFLYEQEKIRKKYEEFSKV